MEDESRIPANAWRAIIIILAVMLALSVYAHFQQSRRDKVETVTVTLLPTATPSPSSP